MGAVTGRRVPRSRKRALPSGLGGVLLAVFAFSGGAAAPGEPELTDLLDGGKVHGPEEGAESAAEAPADRSPARRIEEVIVTAEKTAARYQDVPMSITVLDGDRLDTLGIGRMQDIAQRIPNVYVTNARPNPRVFIRGFGTPQATTSFDQSVSLVLDEMSISQSLPMSLALFDLERFEALRGPQGTLFGRNTPGGLFSVTSREPTREWGGTLRGAVGALDSHQAELAIGGPVDPAGEWARFRIALIDSESPRDVFNTKRAAPAETTQRSGRLSLALDPLHDLEILLIAERASNDSIDRALQADGFSSEAIEFLRGYDPRFEDDGFDHQASSDFPSRIDMGFDRLQANVRYRPASFGPVVDPEVVAVVGGLAFGSDAAVDFDFSPADVFRVPGSVFDHDQRSIEVRAAAGVPAPWDRGDIRFLAGLFLFEASLDTDFPFVSGEDIDEWLLSAPGFEFLTGEPAPGGAGFEDLDAVASAMGLPPPSQPASFADDGIRYDFRQRSTARAVFADVAWRPTGRWSVSAGARVTFETKKAVLAVDCLGSNLVCAAQRVEEFLFRGERNETDVSPRFVVQHFPSDDLSLFATRAAGFKSGGFNNFSPVPEEVAVGPEDAVSWETGLKGRLFDGSLLFGGTLFHMDVDGLQQQNRVGALVQVRNAAGARSRGVELELQWLTPLRPLSLFGGGSFTDARYTDYPNAPPIASSESPTQDLTGRRLPWVSKWQVIATPEIQVPFATPAFPPAAWVLPGRLVFLAGLDVIYRSSLFLDSDLDPRTRQGGHTFVHGRLGFSDPAGKLSLVLFGRNLTDADVIETIIDDLFFPGGFDIGQDYQRTWSLEATFRW